jgi:peptidoglycan hydrolase-like protein with peptidoglycan-binding domain
MKKHGKKILIAFALILAAAAAWYYFKKRKASQVEPGQPTPTPAGSPPAPAVSGPWPLQQGSRNTYVKALQQHLNKAHGAGLVIDGIFGPKTEAAALKYEGKASFTNTDFNKVFGK